VCIGKVQVGREGLRKEIKVTVYGRWTSYIYMKQTEETSSNSFKWVEEETEGER
jgi:hypothetical protein